MTVKHNSKKYLQNKSRELDDALLKSALKGSPQSLRLAYQVLGLLVEKTEETIINKPLSADDLMKIRQEADKRVMDDAVTAIFKHNPPRTANRD